MADLVNLFAESNRDIIGDDTSPTLTLENTSSGNSLLIRNASGTGTALQVNGSRTGAQIRSTATEQVPLDVIHSVINSPTVAVMRVTASGASAPFFEFRGFLASIASAGSIVRGVRVKFGDEYGFIPVYASGTYI